MFYPVDSLKRGGRFYLCWVADSWPLRFATITHRQLWSQDIRKICDDLLEVMTNESGRPVKRFSLRLSSQLMRGLVRLYQRKVTVFLGDLCMINANVTKNVNKKWNIQELVTFKNDQLVLPQLAPLQLTIQEEPENEQRIEEIIQTSGNIVGNIEDITLKESTVPPNLLPPNDGFGEENPEQALQLLKDQTVEMMLVQDGSAIQHSGLDLLVFDTTDKDKSHDKSRLVTHDAAQMEPISEHDVTLFRKSFYNERLTIGGLEKDVPEVPEILLPDLPVPQPEKPMIEDPPAEVVSAPEHQKVVEETAPKEKENSPVEFQLEELEEEPHAKKRRLRNKIIIDKKIKLTTDFLLTRIENPYVDLRCEDGWEDIVDIRVPVDILFRRPCHAGRKTYQNIGMPLMRLFQRNLGVANKRPSADIDIEDVAARRNNRNQQTALERIEEEVVPELQAPPKQPDLELEVFKESELNITEPPNVTVPQEQMDIFDLPTQKIVMESDTEGRKRTSNYDVVELQSKRQRLSGYVSFRQSQQIALERSEIITETDKENLLGVANIQPSEVEVLQTRDTNIPSPRNTLEKSLNVMLEEAGLADLQRGPEEQEPYMSTQKTARRGGSESSETQLGSLDRTKVSLGDSDLTTDSKRFIRDQWGTEGTMIKILHKIKSGFKPLTVKRMIAAGPVIAGYKAVMAARCFTSILKLKQHGFIVIKKNSETLEIVDIHLGPKFDHFK